MKISNSAMDHLLAVGEVPDLSGTRYEMISKLDEGGMAAVFLVRDVSLDREVALKVLKSVHLGDEIRRRLMDEARIVARLEHPGIVPVHDIGVLPDDRIYYAMKYIRGSRLDQFVAESPAQARLLRIFERICDAVAFAHSRGVVHRDLKPQNIMIGPFGEVLVLDWGVAKILGHTLSELPDDGRQGTGGETLQGTVIGTPGYMAPEQMRGDVLATDERADVYALGAILHFLLTGEPPTVGPTLRQTTGGVGGIKDSSFIGCRRFDWTVRVHSSLVAVCEKAAALDQEERYPTVQALSEDIGRFLAQLPVAARPEGFFGRVRRLSFKHRTAIFLVLAYLLMRLIFLLL